MTKEFQFYAKYSDWDNRKLNLINSLDGFFNKKPEPEIYTINP